MIGDVVHCESCNKIMDPSEAMDISDGEGIVMCPECYKKFTEYHVVQPDEEAKCCKCGDELPKAYMHVWNHVPEEYICHDCYTEEVKR